MKRKEKDELKRTAKRQKTGGDNSKIHRANKDLLTLVFGVFSYPFREAKVSTPTNAKRLVRATLRAVLLSSLCRITG